MNEIKQKLQQIIFEKFGIEIEPNVTVAPKNFVADYASNVAMALRKKINKDIKEIAKEIAEGFDGTGIDVEIAEPGFLNFTSSDEYFKQKIVDFSDNFTKNISQEIYSGKTIICEFSDPNPFKVLHVGHLYTSIVGDSISRLFEFAGGKVIRANFGGDVGLHVAKNIYAILRYFSEITDSQGNFIDMSVDGQAEFMAKCYVEGTNAYEESEEAHDEITKLNKILYVISAKGENFVGEWKNEFAEEIKDSDEDQSNDFVEYVKKIAKIYWWGRKTSYQYFEDFYNKIGLKFDKYYPESAVAGKGLEAIRKELENGVYELSNGATVFRGEKYGLHTRVFVNKNGLPTYEAKDVGLILTKDDDWKFDKSVVITGNDIIEYMKVVLKSVEQFRPDLVEKTVHLTHGNVRLSGNEKMSSRKGNFLKAIDVLNGIETLLSEKYGKVDKKIALGAIKYAFLRYKIGGDIIFEPEESISTTGNSGIYLQYSAVRARKILGEVLKNNVEKRTEWKITERERELIKKIVTYKNELEVAIREIAPNKICNFLYELAQEFSRFYETIKVAGSEYEFQRSQIVLAYLKVLTHGLELLGIEVPESM